MPRVSRKDLPGNVYHVMCQGINKEYIFNDDYLKEKYRNIIAKKKEDNNIRIIAYCIMDNHVHMILNTEKNEEMSKFMKKINTTYAQFYNKVKDRVGYVFRDRYLSKPIFSELQLQRCIAYIHKNPVEAKIVTYENEYSFSSYNEYLNPLGNNNVLSKEAMQLAFGTSKIDDFLKQFNFIHNYKNIDLVEFDDFDEKKKSIEDLMNMYEGLGRDDKIMLLNTRNKISERKLAEIFDINRHQIRKILKKN